MSPAPRDPFHGVDEISESIGGRASPAALFSPRESRRVQSFLACGVESIPNLVKPLLLVVEE